MNVIEANSEDSDDDIKRDKINPVEIDLKEYYSDNLFG